jgi:hypothetical protein
MCKVSWMKNYGENVLNRIICVTKAQLCGKSEIQSDSNETLFLPFKTNGVNSKMFGYCGHGHPIGRSRVTLTHDQSDGD